MNCPFSTTDDILDFAHLAQEAVKVMQREERVSFLESLARDVKRAKAEALPNSAVSYARYFFLSEV